jgi:hypothetical protein
MVEGEARLRALFIIYIGGIAIGIAYFTVIGLSHH